MKRRGMGAVACTLFVLAACAPTPAPKAVAETAAPAPAPEKTASAATPAPAAVPAQPPPAPAPEKSAPTAAPEKSAAKAAPQKPAPKPTTTTTKASPPPAAKPGPATAPPAAVATAPAAAPSPPRAAAPLDIKSLEQRLKETNAIGLMTKLSLKNQVDDLLEKFREYHRGQLKASLAELRHPYELLLMKVLSLLQDGDPALAQAINASRDAIWAILADRDKFFQFA